MSTLSVQTAQTAQCADCYTVLFTDEMNPCAEGHWVCPGCVCDCARLSDARAQRTQWAAWGEDQPVSS